LLCSSEFVHLSQYCVATRKSFPFIDQLLPCPTQIRLIWSFIFPVSLKTNVKGFLFPLRMVSLPFVHSLYVKINLMSYVLAIIHLLDRQRTLHYIHHLRIPYPILRISYIQCQILWLFSNLPAISIDLKSCKTVHTPTYRQGPEKHGKLHVRHVRPQASATRPWASRASLWEVPRSTLYWYEWRISVGPRRWRLVMSQMRRTVSCQAGPGFDEVVGDGHPWSVGSRGWRGSF